jgi:hypothetical protein
MLTNWIPQESLAALNDGFVVAIMLEAKDGESDALAEILRVMTAPTMAEPGVKPLSVVSRLMWKSSSDSSGVMASSVEGT